MTEVFKVMAFLGPNVMLSDAIEHEGAVWLIPKWLEATAQGWRQPERMIRADSAALQKMTGGLARYMLRSPIPAIALDTVTALDHPVQVVLSPEIRFALPP